MTALLLDLACSSDRMRVEDLQSLSDDDWSVLDQCAAQHRLQPILHDRLAADPSVPRQIRAAWRDSYRFWAIKAAAARVDLAETVALLEANGFAPLALKGAYLAWHAYPAPALRPLRDIDILVSAAGVADAFALLCDHGWTVAPVLTPAGGKHLTPLVARCGTLIELHHRLWERESELDHGSPVEDHDAVRVRAVTIDGIAYPCAEDMLAHLIVHAVYSHRLDCGPLLLWDIWWLVGTKRIDWDTLRARASHERWQPGLDLIIALSRRYFGQDAIPRHPHEAPPPADLVDAAAELLLQDLDTRRSASLAATATVRGVGAVAARVTRGASARLDRGERRNPAAEGLGAWSGTRLRRTIGELSDRAVRDQARGLIRLSRWLGA